MKYLFLSWFFLGICALDVSEVYAGQRPVLNAGHVFDRDYSFLSDPSQRSDPLDAIKYISLGNDKRHYLSLGGELRERYEGFVNNPLFGIGGRHSDHYLLHRAMIHADLHVDDFRTFIQLAHHDVYSKEGAVNATERSHVDIQQVFAQYILPQGWVRFGRQEMAFGTQRLVGYREGPNIRQSFDGIRLNRQWRRTKADFFLTRPTEIKPDHLDDKPDDQQLFWGVHTTTMLTDRDAVDLYYFKFDRDRARFAAGIADEHRHSVGARLWNKNHSVDYNVELVYQSGRFGSDSIRAWTASSDTGYSPANMVWRPRFAVKSSIASGDSDLNDNRLQTFNPLFPRGAFFTENALVGPANFFDIHPSIALKPSASLTITPSIQFVWRQDTADAVYRQPSIAVPGTAGKAGRYTGTQFQLATSWRATAHTELNLAYVHFDVGDAIKAAGGNDSNYLSSWVSFRF